MRLIYKRWISPSHLLIRKYTIANNNSAKTTSLKHIQEAAIHLRNAGITDALIEAERLWALSMGYNNLSEWYIANDDILYNCLPQFREWISRRALREPFHYLTGWKEFYGRKFKVNTSCLIPRPETEMIIDIVKETFHTTSIVHILELGTGSGCIGISVAKELNQSTVTITDICRDTLEIAWENANLWAVTDRLRRAKGSWFDFNYIDSITSCEKTMIYDGILSNPPYLSHSDMLNMAPELSYEPMKALYGGEDGLDGYRQISQRASSYLKPNGRVIVEIGAHQDEAVIHLFMTYGFRLEKSFQDLQSITRILMFQYNTIKDDSN
jgi:release factor glutamine methyltransferase